ncbi:MAG: hypothetical protein GY953_52470 [bacterium]|nr:hypothetical protein [bacterium]
MEQLSFTKHFRRMVLSNSSFAWWAALLSDATDIYGPRAAHPEAYGFTGYRDLDLETREPRFHLVDGIGVAPFELYLHPAEALDWAEITAVDGSLATWISEHEHPFPVTAIPRHMMGPDLEPTITHLVASGAVRVEARYLDDGPGEAEHKLARLAREIRLIDK